MEKTALQILREADALLSDDGSWNKFNFTGTRKDGKGLCYCLIGALWAVSPEAFGPGIDQAMKRLADVIRSDCEVFVPPAGADDETVVHTFNDWLNTGFINVKTVLQRAITREASAVA